MSVYTTQVRYICETLAGKTQSVGYMGVDEVITKAAPAIFQDFPLFDEAYRLTLEKKILQHYYMREIGFETEYLWIMKLNIRLNEIMPYYNQLYKSAAMEINPFIDVDYTREYERGENEIRKEDRQANTQTEATNEISSVNEGEHQQSGTGHTTNESSGSGTTGNTDLFSNTPQGGLNGQPIFTQYLTEARKNDGATTTLETGSGSTTTQESGTVSNKTDTAGMNKGKADSTESATGNIDTTEKYLEHIKGKNPGISYSELLKQYRETFLNIDMMIIHDLADLFFLLY